MENTMFSVNKVLAVKPLRRDNTQVQIKGGIAVMSQGVDTVTSELLFEAMIDNEYILAGTQVTFLGEKERSDWNTRIYSHKGVNFVLAPYTEVAFLTPPETKT